ncbi:MAG: carbon storage regulator [Gemmatimonadaceae bacterium]|nr:carbon storage regulator [Gemmatimonadaceae bacterium]
MLILGRREGESILIDGGIKIVVVACDRGGVRIGIEAPSSVKILRGEIADQVAKENQRAATAPVSTEWMAALGLGAAVTPVTPVATEPRTPAPSASPEPSV